MKRSQLVVALVAVLLGSIAFLTWRQRAPRSTVAALAARPSPPPRTGATPDAVATLPSGDRRAEAPPAVPQGREQAERELQASVARDRALFDQLFQAEPAGTDAATMRSAVDRALNDPAVRQARDLPRSTQVECKNSQCRVLATFAPAASPDDWQTRLAIAGGATFGSLRVLRTTNAQGEQNVALFLYQGSSHPALRDPVTGGGR